MSYARRRFLSTCTMYLPTILYIICARVRNITYLHMYRILLLLLLLLICYNAVCKVPAASDNSTFQRSGRIFYRLG